MKPAIADRNAGDAFFQPCPARRGCICAGGGDGHLAGLEAAWRAMSDGIFCICLQERPDRFEAACDEAHRWGLCRLTLFYRPRKPTDAELAAAGVKCRGFFGSWESHRAVARHALRSNVKRALILEDDFHILRDTSEDRLRQIAEGMFSLPEASWDLFFLGHQPIYGRPVDVWMRVFRTHSCWIHSYILNRPGQTILANNSYCDVARAEHGEQTLDGWLRGATRQYAAFPMIAVQSSSESDNLPPTDLYGRVFAWWTGVHKAHSLAIEVAVFFILPVLVALLALFLLWLAFSAATAVMRAAVTAISPENGVIE
jgi:GR25 family glycosyltransferase involved in LPS biosynthesis